MSSIIWVLVIITNGSALSIPVRVEIPFTTEQQCETARAGMLLPKPAWLLRPAVCEPRKAQANQVK